MRERDVLGYRLLGQTGLRVSEVCLGTMSFGERWGFGATEAVSHQILDRFVAAGGNFVDTANMYHGGQTESFLGRWWRDEPSRRHRMVVASKCTLATDHSDVNSAGAHGKNLIRAVDDSLRRLQTDHLDLLWIHAWDQLTPMSETMRALDDLVRAGKVRYLGASDTPAWVVSASQVLAELRGWTAFAGIQVEYSLLARTPERDLIPMAEHMGMSVLCWGALGGGVLTGKYTKEGQDRGLREAGNAARGRTTEQALQIAGVVDRVARDTGMTSAQVAASWILGGRYATIPIVGARTPEQLEDTLQASQTSLTAEARAALDTATAVSLGFPHDFLAEPHLLNSVYTKLHTRIAVPPARGGGVFGKR